MSKTLQVVEPFFTLKVGDIMELSQDGKNYVHEINESFGVADVNDDIRSSYSSTFAISVNYAMELIKDGYLAEVTNDKQNFVNIFTEIDNLLDKYTKELSTIDTDFKDVPMCVKVEKTTVLKNMIKLLNHLKSLKK